MYLNDSNFAQHQSTVDPYRGFSGLGESPQCNTACMGLKSMEQAAEGVCRTGGIFSCINARLRVLKNRAKIHASGCSCSDAPRVASPSAGPPAAMAGYGLGQIPQRRRGPSLLPPPDPQLRMPPNETIEGFRHHVVTLTSPQLERVNRIAEFIGRSWTTTSPVTSIRVTGYINADEYESGLGERRAIAVRDALISALNRQRPGLVTRINWTTEDRGYAPSQSPSASKVEIYLWIGPTPPPVPPLRRLPSPAEAARTVVSLGPETAEQRIQRILRELPPEPAPRRSFNQMFWQKVDERLNSTMSRLNVPNSLRPHIRDGVHAAIRRGSEALLNEIVGTTRLPSEVQDAIRTTARALLEVPISR